MGNRAERHSNVRTLGRVLVATGIALGIGSVVDACGGGSDNSPASNTPINTPIHPETTEMPSQTATATKITESPSPTIAPTPTAVKETPAPVNCEILPQEYCSQAKLVEAKDARGNVVKFVGFRFSEKVAISSPFDGQGVTGKGNMLNPDAFWVNIVADDDKSLSFSVYGDFKPTSQSAQLPIKKDGIVAYTQQTGINMLGDYTIVLTINRKDPERGFVVDEKMLREYFPAAFTE